MDFYIMISVLSERKSIGWGLRRPSFQHRETEEEEDLIPEATDGTFIFLILASLIPET